MLAFELGFFIQFMSNCEMEFLVFLASVMDKIKPHLKLVTTHEEMFNLANRAGDPDFRLPKKGY